MSQKPKAQKGDPPVRVAVLRLLNSIIRYEHGGQHYMEKRKRGPKGQVAHIPHFVTVCVIGKAA